MRRLLVFAGGLYLFTLGILFAFQRQLVFAAQESRTPAATDDNLPTGAKKVRFATAAGTVIAYYGHALRADGRPDTDYRHRPTLLFFYGKGGSFEDSRQWFQSFRRLDANVLMPDYVGFGQSGGQESEANCYATAQACYQYLRRQPDIDQKSLVIAGFSLGSGVAVDLAARELQARQPVAGLALFAAYTSLAEEAHQEYPIYPTPLLRLLLKYPFNSEQKMPGVACPVLLVHSRADRLIPFWMSDRLAAACSGHVTRLNIDHSDHAYYFLTDGKLVYRALGQFLEKTKSHHETQLSVLRRAA